MDAKSNGTAGSPTPARMENMRSALQFRGANAEEGFVGGPQIPVTIYNWPICHTAVTTGVAATADTLNVMQSS
jgi:hypothetical protein